MGAILDQCFTILHVENHFIKSVEAMEIPILCIENVSCCCASGCRAGANLLHCYLPAPPMAFDGMQHIRAKESVKRDPRIVASGLRMSKVIRTRTRISRTRVIILRSLAVICVRKLSPGAPSPNPHESGRTR
jgi:hypothetical protein